MSNIRFFALGGLSENGKNMYVFEVNGNIYILDAGIKYPSQELFGVDEIVPDYRILLRAEKKIKGIFLSHAHEDHIGAIPHLLKELNVPVYATKFTMQVLALAREPLEFFLRGTTTILEMSVQIYYPRMTTSNNSITTYTCRLASA
jgi:ribonuclease J